MPELTSKGSRYRKALYQYPTSVDESLYGMVANRVIVEINSFANPYPYVKRQIRRFITSYLEEQGIGTKKVNYKLRDWVFSRQRYWINAELCAKN